MGEECAVSSTRMPHRCEWAEVDDSLLVTYHDEEWGTPSHEDRHLFELLTLEGAQAGLSWRTILHKRQGYDMQAAGLVNDHVMSCFRYRELSSSDDTTTGEPAPQSVRGRK